MFLKNNQENILMKGKIIDTNSTKVCTSIKKLLKINNNKNTEQNGGKHKCLVFMTLKLKTIHKCFFCPYKRHSSMLCFNILSPEYPWSHDAGKAGHACR